MIHHKLNIIEVIDWYDGVVLALVSVDESKSVYLCSLIAFDLELKQRVFALLPLEQNEFSSIKKSLDQDWEDLSLHLKFLWGEADGNILLVLYSDETNQILTEKKVLAGLVKDYAISEVELTVSSERKHWFEMF